MVKCPVGECGSGECMIPLEEGYVYTKATSELYIINEGKSELVYKNEYDFPTRKEICVLNEDGNYEVKKCPT